MAAKEHQKIAKPTDKQRGRGRPAGDPDLRRSRELRVRLNAAEWDQVADLARAIGQPVSAYVRARILPRV